MTAESDLEHVAAAERHNRLAKQIVSEIVYAPICDGGSMSDVMMLCESVLVGVPQFNTMGQQNAADTNGGRRE